MARRARVSATAKKVTVEQPVQNEQAIIEAIKKYQREPSVNEDAVKDDEQLTEEQRLFYNTLDGAMQPLPNMELSRITVRDFIEDYLSEAGVETIKLLQGHTITHKPYMSTSREELNDRLERRYRVGLEKPVCLIVHTEGKALGVDLSAKEEFVSQQEVILKRGQQFLVKKVETGDGWGEVYPIIHLYAV